MVLGKWDGASWSIVGTTNAPANTLSGAAITSFSDFSGGSIVALPIELADFNAYAENKTVELVWSTASEQNSDHFEVERSADGRDWKMLGRKNAAGNDTDRNDYSFTDYSPLPMNFYRLRMVDTDGKTALSKVIAIRLNEQALLTVSPNPVSGFLNIQLDKSLESGSTIALFDAAGQLVTTITPQEQANCRLDLSKLAPGIYFLRVQDNTGQLRWQKSIIKQ